MPFVVETERTTNTPNEFNDALLKFMHIIQHDWTQQINEWREEEMSSEAVYKVRRALGPQLTMFRSRCLLSAYNCYLFVCKCGVKLLPLKFTCF
jgi:hypothetical protein